MELYLLKFSGCLVGFWLVYLLLLEKQKMHQFKRFYLLGAFVAALIIPLLTITYYVEPVIDFGTYDPNSVFTPPYFPAELPIAEGPPTDYLPTILWSIYAIGVALFSIRFITSLVILYKRISKNETIKQRPFIYVLMQHYHVPHSFFNYIFFSKSKYETSDIPREVILHEETHAKQLHSLDILAVEILQIIFWFHPLVYLLKHHIKLNHEFLADQAVLEDGTDAKNYQHILLQFSSSDHNNALSSAINYSSFKKRFTVMKTQTSKRKIWASIALLLPIAAVLFYSFSTKAYVVKEPTIETAQNQFSQFEINQNEASEKLMSEYNVFIEKYKQTNIIIGDKYERAIIIYDNLMSDNQRASVEKYPARLVPESNLSKVTPKQPTKAQFEAFKNKADYAIWIDGNHVPNSELNNYVSRDFVHVIGSKVYENARSEKFPQPNQYNLYTKEGFKKTYQDAQVNKYKSVQLEYSRKRELFLNGFLSDNSELKILKAQADNIYNTLRKSDIFSNALNPVPSIPIAKNLANTSNYTETGFTTINNELYFYVIKNNKKHYYNTKGFETDSSGKQISKTQINASDVVKDQYITKVYKNSKVVVTFKDNWDDAEKEKNFQLIENTTISESDILATQSALLENQIKILKTNKNKNITLLEHWYITIDNTKYYYPYKKGDLKKYYDKYGTEVDLDIIKEYRKKYKTFEALKNTGKHYVYKSKEAQEEIDHLFSDLGGMYFRLVRADKVKVQRPTTPIRPYVKITLNGKTYYKKSSELTNEERATLPPPPPPAPPTPPSTSTNQDIPTLKQVAEYNAWAKKFKKNASKLSEKKKIEGYPVMNQRKFNYYNSIYKKLSGEQLKTAESFPEAVLAPPPPPPPYHKGKVSEDMMNSYNKWITELKNLDGTYNIVTKEDYNYFISIYNNMTDEQKEASKLPPPPPPPSTPSTKKSKGGPNSSNIITNQSIPSKSSEDCLELPKAFITTNGKTLDISCINEHPKNSIEIYNKWGKRVYKKDNYNNDWDGTVAKEYASEGTNKPIADSYYYVFKSDKLNKEKVGYILINKLKADGIDIKKMTGSEIANVNSSKSTINQNNSDDCLEIPSEFNISTTKALTIKCIDQHPVNTLQIFNRWGNKIFSKENYNNKWNGKNDGEIINEGTYYYVFSSPKLKEPKAGPIHFKN